jgi:hypothetical protein
VSNGRNRLQEGGWRSEAHGVRRDNAYAWLQKLLGNETALRHAFQQVPELANRLTANAGFLETFLSRRDLMKTLLVKKVLDQADGSYLALDALLETVSHGHDGAVAETRWPQDGCQQRFSMGPLWRGGPVQSAGARTRDSGVCYGPGRSCGAAKGASEPS